MTKKGKLLLLIGSVSLSLAMVVTTATFDHGFTLFSQAGNQGDYSLTLNSDNGISGSNVTTTKSITTDSGMYAVNFSYTNCSSLSGGHALLANNGKIVNADHIRSISQLTASFSTSGELKFRASYDGATWSGYTSMKSGEKYDLGSNPYYIEFSTDGSHTVNLVSAKFTYTCQENPTANESGSTTSDTYYFQKVTTAKSDWSGEYMAVWEESATSGRAFKGQYNNGAYESVTISDGRIDVVPITTLILAKSGNNYTAKISGTNNNNKYIYGTSNSNYLNIGTSADNTITVAYQTSAANGFGLKWGNYPFRMNDGSNGADATWAFKFYKPTSSLNSEQSFCKLYEKVYNPAYETPVDENGFTANDTKKNSYTTNSIFDSENGLSVVATFNNGTTQPLTSGYTYKIFNSNNQQINTAAKFPAEGIYTLKVEYKNYIPAEIQLNVGLYTYITGISARMTTTTFTTADRLSDNLNGNLVVDLSYNVSALDKTIGYSELSNYGLTMSLINPSEVSYTISNPFGTAGAWKVHVVSSSDSSIYSDVALTVNAIQVIDISMSQANLTLHVGEHANLTVTFNPTNATNQNVTWTSSNASIASVSNGTVTANAVGGPITITATSQDGNHTATCSVTVKKVAATTATITSNSSGTENQAASISASGFTTDGISLTSASSSGYVYYGSSKTYRFGKSGQTGSITFNFASTLISGVKVNMAAYGSDSGVTVKVATSANTTGQTLTLNGSSYEDYDYTDFSSDISESTSLTISTTTGGKRMYLKSITLTCGVAEPIYLDSISLSDESIIVGESVALNPVFSPSDANQTDLVWHSSDTSIATVSDKGIVTGVGAGEVTITATGKDENNQDISDSCTVTVTAISVTGVNISQETAMVGVGKSFTISVDVLPYNASNKNVTWTSSDTSKATVNSNGLITGVATGTATITAETEDGNKIATCQVTVSNKTLSDWTWMFYVCGSNLESDAIKDGGGCATSDLNEVLSKRTSQPSSVKIVVETGGASTWRTSNIDNNKINRFEINSSSSSMIKKQTLNNASMGESSTLQSFLEWSFENYPSQHYGLIMWNHGGAMEGCCYDENFDDDNLKTNEVHAAVTAARSSKSIYNKLDIMCYDACLMAVQDVAEYNSLNFNYMVSSQETEWSGGYDYDAWLPTLYNNPSTVDPADICIAIGETFMNEQEGDGHNDQTQSVLDLTKMKAYKDLWEDMTDSLSTIVNSSSKWNTFANEVNKALKYGYSSYASDYNDGYSYDIFDIKGALEAVKSNSTFSSASTQIDRVLNKLTGEKDQVVIYNRFGSNSAVKNSCGLCLFCPISGYNQKTGAYFYNSNNEQVWYEDTYSASRTNFTKWQAFVVQWGNWAA